MVSYEPDRVFVGGLPSTCDANDKLTAFFQQFGAVRESKVFVDLDTGRPKGFGFVRFENPASVEAALANDASNVIDGKWVSAKRCEIGGPGKAGGGASWIGSPNSLEDAGLWIRGLPLEYTEGLLKAFAEQYGEVVDVKILPRRFPNNPDQAGLLRMKTVDQANWLVDNLNGKVLEGFPMPLTVRKSSKDKQNGQSAGQPALTAPASTWGVAPPATTAVAVPVQQHQPYVVPPFNLSGQYQYQATASPQYDWSVQQYQYQVDASPQAYQQAQYGQYQQAQYGQQAQQAGSNNAGLSADRLWIRGLPLGYTDGDLRELFSRYGIVSDCKVLPQKYPQNPDLSGVVRMSTPAEAGLCMDQLNNQAPPGFNVPIHMRYARNKDTPQPNQQHALVPAAAPVQGGIEPDRIFISGLPDSCDDATLALFFSQFGSVLEAKVSLDPHTQRSRGFGFVRFSDAVGPLQAIAHGDSNVIDGKRVMVKPSQVQHGSSGTALQQPEYAASPQAWGYASTQQGAGSVGDGCGLFVRGLPLSYDAAALKAFFEQWVIVAESKVLPRRFAENPDQAGLVRLASAEQAQWCVQVLDGTQPQGFPMPLSVKLSTSTAPGSPGGAAEYNSTFATQNDVAPFALANTAHAPASAPVATPVVIPPFITQPAESAPSVAATTAVGSPPGNFADTENATQGVKRSSEGFSEPEAKVPKA